MPQKDSAENAVRDIRRKTRRKFSAEEKIRIVLEGLRGEHRFSMPPRRHRGEPLLPMELGVSRSRGKALAR